MDERKLRHLVWERVLALSDRSSIDVYAMLLLPNLLHRTARTQKAAACALPAAPCRPLSDRSTSRPRRIDLSGILCAVRKIE